MGYSLSVMTLTCFLKVTAEEKRLAVMMIPKKKKHLYKKIKYGERRKNREVEARNLDSKKVVRWL